MAIDETYGTVKTIATSLRQKILNKIFDSRFESMISAIKTSADIAKDIGENIQLSNTQFLAYGDPLKIAHISSISPNVNSVEDKIITPVWEGNTDTVTVNNQEVELISIPELELTPPELAELSANVSKVLNYTVFIVEPFNESRTSYYDVYDWSFGYILPDEISAGYYEIFIMTEGYIRAPIPVDITSLLASSLGENILEAYYPCWRGVYYIITFRVDDDLALGIDIYLDCNITIYDPNDGTKLGVIYSPLIVNTWGINYNILHEDSKLRITNLADLPINVLSEGDVYAFFGAYSPVVNCVKIGTGTYILTGFSGRCPDSW